MYRSIKVIAVLTLASQAIAGGNGQGNIHSRTGFGKVSYSVRGDRGFDRGWSTQRGYRTQRYRDERPARRNLKPSVEIDRHVRDTSFPLRRLLGPEDAGRRLKKVVVDIGRVRGKARISLVGDGRVLDSVKVRHSRRVILKPGRDVVVGRLRLRVEGGAHIRKITAKLDRRRVRYADDRYREPCEDRVSRVGYDTVFYGALDLDRIIGLQGAHGCRIQSVEFKVASQYGGGHGALVVDGRVVSHQGPIGRRSEWIGFNFNDCPVYGREGRDISLQLLGAVRVESARVRFAR